MNEMTDVSDMTESKNEIDEIFHGNIETLLVDEKLDDALTPGFTVEFDPEEAALAGAFMEDALSEEDAAESNIDLMDAMKEESK